MLWAMLGTMVAIWAIVAVPFAVVIALKRRSRARKAGRAASAGKAPGGFSRRHDPAKSPTAINPKTGSP
jgi:hypothetical protein